MQSLGFFIQDEVAKYIINDYNNIESSNSCSMSICIIKAFNDEINKKQKLKKRDSNFLYFRTNELEDTRINWQVKQLKIYVWAKRTFIK